MTNEMVMQAAKKLLGTVNTEELETIQINHTVYDDGSKSVTIELTYPKEKTDNILPITTPDIVIDGKSGA